MNFKGKTVIVTGGSRGIGKAIAQAFAQREAKVVIIDILEDSINETVVEFKQNGWLCSGFRGDVTNNEQMGEIFKMIHEEQGTIDVLINNAGITRDGLLMKMKESDWDAVINVNLKGTFNCTQKVVRHMLKQREGVIINIASVIGIMGNVGQANYAASKAGIIGLTKSTAKELAVRNVRCNAIAPGFIKTAMTDTLAAEVVESYSQAIPMRRMGLPEDVADLCLFLASDLSSYITGQVINVDGGLIM
ncbi:MAG: 3-oxoacyl-[acyl-carrier-protein] reductase [Candidatus Cloacimonetes bacterium]|nr:3-oxoacyl-[acyl-carrier-protein] reductase [Candidatus Cloacimonadota bacterium]